MSEPLFTDDQLRTFASLKRGESRDKIVEHHDLKSLIELDRYHQEQTAGSRSTLPVRIAKFKLGGAT